jgi:very-short-patch-repair endonuclease
MLPMRQPVPPNHRRFARTMRAEATKAENMLWQAIRNRQLEGLKFRRQAPLDGYIADFACFDPKMIVEVDGGQHAESSRDADRDRHFAAQGFKVLRFWNKDVERNLNDVCREILIAAGRAIRSPLLQNLTLGLRPRR